MKSLHLLLTSMFGLIGLVSYSVIKPEALKKQPDPITRLIKYPGKAVVQFNSEWNMKNEYKWKPIPGVRYTQINIDKFPQYRKTYRLRSLPTIIIFNRGKEEARFEANIMLKLELQPQELNNKLK